MVSKFAERLTYIDSVLIVVQMATIRVKIITKVKEKRKRGGEIMYTIKAINPDSQICFMNTEKQSDLKNWIPNATLVVKSCRIYNREQIVFVHFTSDTKVC